MCNSNMEAGYLVHVKERELLKKHNTSNKYKVDSSKSGNGKNTKKNSASTSKFIVNALRDDVIFPRMFTEVRSRGSGPYVVRVRSKLSEAEKVKQKKMNDTNELRRTANKLAAVKLRKIANDKNDDVFNESDGEEEEDALDLDLL
uniref:Tubby-related protein 4 n=1 Tax=Lygus hesperus TaxID=30085 RepID=A0A0A9WMV3_LYGHE